MNLLRVLLLLAASALSSEPDDREVFARYGAISDTGHLSAFPSEKLFVLGFRDDWLKIFTYQIEFGGIFDGRDNANSSALLTLSSGLRTQTRPFYIYYLPGVAFITGPDDYLSSFYQFSHDIGGGMKDSRGVSIDFTYRHFSNMGLHMPNPGRNFLALKMGIPFSILGL